jgi:Na+:H+ antiporter, NhaA family
MPALLRVRFLISGVHATLAGVLAAFTVPARVRIPPHRLAQVVRRAADRLEALDAEGDMDSRRFAVVSFLRKVTQDAKTPLQRFEHMAHPWVVFVIMPIFALFNAGIAIDSSAFAALLDPLPLGVAAGLVLGKQVGVFAATWLLVRTGAASLPQGVSWGHIYGVAWLTGIGFTMRRSSAALPSRLARSIRRPGSGSSWARSCPASAASWS